MLRGFVFQTTPSILAETGATGKIGKIAAELGCTKVAFITDKGIMKARIADQALAGLKKAGIGVWLFDEVVPDSPSSLIEDIARRARAEGVDGVVSVGGGSSLDTAKLIAVLTRSDQPLSDMFGENRIRGGRLPLVLAPTTAGTGSEVSRMAIIVKDLFEVSAVASPVLFPDWAVLDPDLTIGLPPEITAISGLDAMVDAIEAYTSRTHKNVMSDTLTKQALILLGGNIVRACKHPNDREARGAMLLGSMLAGMAFSNAPVGAVHALAYPVGGRFHVPHGHANAIILPHVVRYNMPLVAGLYAEIAPLIFPELVITADPAEEMPDCFVRLIGDLGLSTTLSQVGVTGADLPVLVEDAMRQNQLLPNNPREVKAGDALSIYRAAL